MDNESQRIDSVQLCHCLRFQRNPIYTLKWKVKKPLPNARKKKKLNPVMKLGAKTTQIKVHIFHKNINCPYSNGLPNPL